MIHVSDKEYSPLHHASEPSHREYLHSKTIITQWFAKLCIIINSIIGVSLTVSPSATIGCTLHPTLDGMIIQYFHILRSGGSSHSTCQVYLNTRLLTGRESELQYSTMRCRTTLYFNLIISQFY